MVIADASFVQPEELSEFLADTIDLSDKRVAVFCRRREVSERYFPFIWESFLNAGLLIKQMRRAFDNGDPDDFQPRRNGGKTSLSKVKQLRIGNLRI